MTKTITLTLNGLDRAVEATLVLDDEHLESASMFGLVLDALKGDFIRAVDRSRDYPWLRASYTEQALAFGATKAEVENMIAERIKADDCGCGKCECE